jgi:uncharacterized membrane protein
MRKKNGIRRDILHESFEFGILLKRIDGVLEILGGFIMLLLNPSRLDKLIVLLTQHELSEDPKDFISNYLIKFSSGFSISTQHFGSIYLFSHGIIKLILVYLLWKKKIWSYPLAVLFMIIFIFYQVYRYTFTHSIWLIFLTVFDIAMIVLTLIEYKRIKMLNALD